MLQDFFFLNMMQFFLRLAKLITSATFSLTILKKVHESDFPNFIHAC